MNTEITDAQAAVQAARARVLELQNVRAFVADALPKARQALEAAVAAERRLVLADGSAHQAQCQSEIERLTAAINHARGE
jgi:hypothetical protein